MDLIEVKDILQIKTEKHDSYIGTVLPLFLDAAKEYCNNGFTDSEGTEDIPAGVRLAVAKWIEFNMHTAGVQSRSQGVSYSYSLELPDSVKILLRPHRRVRFT